MQISHLDLVIVDTAGRLAVDEEMMDEIELLSKGDQTSGNIVRS